MPSPNGHSPSQPIALTLPSATTSRPTAPLGMVDLPSEGLFRLNWPKDGANMSKRDLIYSPNMAIIWESESKNVEVMA